MNCGWERGKTAFITGKIHNSKEGCCRAHLWLPARGGWDQTLNWAIQQTSQQNKKTSCTYFILKTESWFWELYSVKAIYRQHKVFLSLSANNYTENSGGILHQAGWHKYLINPSPPGAEVVGSLQIQCYPGLASSSRTVRATQWGKNINFNRFCLKPF